MNNRHEHKKKINIVPVLSFLNHTFAKIQQSKRTGKPLNNSKHTPLHKFQVDFAYLVNDIETGPVYMVPKKISEANELIAEFEAWNPDQ